MSRTRERSLHELYADDPERADAVIFGRRGFLKGASLAAMGAAVGASIPFAARMPSGLVPAALAQGQPGAGAAPAPLRFPGKDPGLAVLGERPLVAETPEHLLDDETTPTPKFFIRNNGQIPEPVANPDAWRVRIDGEVNAPLDLALGEIRSRFRPVTLTWSWNAAATGDRPSRRRPAATSGPTGERAAPPGRACACATSCRRPA
jgi:hypothetical protein